MGNVEKFLACDGTVKLTCVNTIDLVKKIKEVHNLSGVEMKVFADLLIIGVMLGADLKEDTDNITFQIKSTGLISQMVCVVKKGAKIKGYIEKNANINENTTDIINGTLYVMKDMGLKEPYIGIVPIEEGNIVNSFIKYYVSSEQIPTIISTGINFNETGLDICSSGGYFLQLMPDAKEETTEMIENNVKNIPSMTNMLNEKISLSDIAKKITGDNNILVMLGEINNEYVCDCTRKKFEKGLISLGKAELKTMIEDGESIKTKCHFCNKEYIFTIDDMKQMLIEKD